MILGHLSPVLQTPETGRQRSGVAEKASWPRLAAGSDTLLFFPQRVIQRGKRPAAVGIIDPPIRAKVKNPLALPQAAS